MSTLLDTSPVIDPIDSIEQTLRTKYNHFSRIFQSPILQIKSLLKEEYSKSSFSNTASTFYIDLFQAFVYAILSAEDHTCSSELFAVAHSMVEDGWQIFTNHLKYFSYTAYTRINALTRSNLLWLVEHLVSLDATGTEGLVIGLLRNGDVQVLGILKEHITWLSRHLQVIPYALITAMSLQDSFVIELFDTFGDVCLDIGRDFVLLLQIADELSTWKSVWKHLLQKDMISSLLCKPTLKRYTSALLPLELETWLTFLQEHVKLSDRHQYMRWIEERYNHTKDVAIARYLIVSYHPNNTQLASGTVQRWAILMDLLLKTHSEDLLLAVIYDWLFFDSSKDSIMLIEPAILLLFHTSILVPLLCESIICFIDDTIKQLHSPLHSLMQKCIKNGMKMALDKRVIPSLEPLIKCSETTKSLVHVLFIEDLVKPDALLTATTDNTKDETMRINKEEIEILKDKIKMLVDVPISFEMAQEMIQQWQQLMPNNFTELERLLQDSSTEWKTALNQVFVNPSISSWSEQYLQGTFGNALEKILSDKAVDEENWRILRLDLILNKYRLDQESLQKIALKYPNTPQVLELESLLNVLDEKHMHLDGTDST